MRNPLTCAILAGGLSERMGRDKATLRFGERSLIEGVYSQAIAVFDKVFIVSTYYSPIIKNIDAPVIRDVLPLKSALVGIVAAFLHSETSHVFVLACDMPFASQESICAVTAAWGDEDIVLPKTDAGFEPLHALYGRSCIPHMLNALQRGKLSIQSIFPYLSVRTVENHPAFFADGRPAFFNVNTESES